MVAGAAAPWSPSKRSCEILLKILVLAKSLTLKAPSKIREVAVVEVILSVSTLSSTAVVCWSSRLALRLYLTVRSSSAAPSTIFLLDTRSTSRLSKFLSRSIFFAFAV